MKKIYNSPVTELINIQLGTMIAGSLGTMSTDGGEVDMKTQELAGGVEGEARSNSIWDDED